MTLFVGAFARHSRARIDPAIKDQLRRSISRHPGEEVTEFDGGRAFLAHVDVGAYGASGVHTSPDGAVTLLAGDPLLGVRNRDPKRTRSDDVALLHRSLRDDDDSPLALSKEVFALAHFDPVAGRIVLATDRLGIRPVYVWRGENAVVFATALRVLEECAALPKTVDFTGYCQLASMSTTIGSRTPYIQISRLRAAEIAIESDRGSLHHRYFDWNIPRSTESLDVLAERAFSEFERAIHLRLRGDRTVASLLSGGLDSRCLVAMLRQRGTTVHTVNLRGPGPERLDNVLSRRYAEHAGTLHQQLPLPPEPPSNLSGAIRAHWDRLEWARDASVEHPRLVWHGFDGSFTVGYVHMHRECISLLARGDVDAGFHRYAEMRGTGLWSAGMRSRYARHARNAIVDSMKQAYLGIEVADAGRRLYLYHLLEECRSLLGDLYEDADLRRMEFHMPLADPDLVAVVASVPSEDAIGHAFYMRMIEHRIPDGTLSIPWQTYKGHAPCPLPTEGLVDQWDRWKEWERQLHNTGSQVSKEVRDGEFPSDVFRRSAFWAALALHHVGRTNYDYAFRDVRTMQRLLLHADGISFARPSRPATYLASDYEPGEEPSTADWASAPG